MTIMDDYDADPDSAWLHDPDPLVLDDAAREELLRFVDALEALDDDVTHPVGLVGAEPAEASDFVSALAVSGGARRDGPGSRARGRARGDRHRRGGRV